MGGGGGGGRRRAEVELKGNDRRDTDRVLATVWAWNATEGAVRGLSLQGKRLESISSGPYSACFSSLR
jgi:hypothetical protein